MFSVALRLRRRTELNNIKQLTAIISRCDLLVRKDAYGIGASSSTASCRKLANPVRLIAAGISHGEGASIKAHAKHHLRGIDTISPQKIEPQIDLCDVGMAFKVWASPMIVMIPSTMLLAENGLMSPKFTGYKDRKSLTRSYAIKLNHDTYFCMLSILKPRIYHNW